MVTVVVVTMMVVTVVMMAVMMVMAMMMMAVVPTPMPVMAMMVMTVMVVAVVMMAVTPPHLGHLVLRGDRGGRQRRSAACGEARSQHDGCGDRGEDCFTKRHGSSLGSGSRGSAPIARTL